MPLRLDPETVLILLTTPATRIPGRFSVADLDRRRGWPGPCSVDDLRSCAVTSRVTVPRPNPFFPILDDTSFKFAPPIEVVPQGHPESRSFKVSSQQHLCIFTCELEEVMSLASPASVARVWPGPADSDGGDSDSLELEPGQSRPTPVRASESVSAARAIQLELEAAPVEGHSAAAVTDPSPTSARTIRVLASTETRDSPAGHSRVTAGSMTINLKFGRGMTGP